MTQKYTDESDSRTKAIREREVRQLMWQVCSFLIKYGYQLGATCTAYGTI